MEFMKVDPELFQRASTAYASAMTDALCSTRRSQRKEEPDLRRWSRSSSSVQDRSWHADEIRPFMRPTDGRAPQLVDMSCECDSPTTSMPSSTSPSTELVQQLQQVAKAEERDHLRAAQETACERRRIEHLLARCDEEAARTRALADSLAAPGKKASTDATMRRRRRRRDAGRGSAAARARQ